MQRAARILIADDSPDNRLILEARLGGHGYEIRSAVDGEEVLALVGEWPPDLILLDVMMPKLDGIEVCRALRRDPSVPYVPIVIISARTGTADVVSALEAGADEYLTKPTNQTALLARVKSMLRIKELYDKNLEQAAQLRDWNQTLEQRVKEEVARVGQLKQFFTPQLAELIASGGGATRLGSHRQEITVVFCDLRDYSEFSTAAEPEDEMRVLREYLEILGTLIARFEATLDHLAGDGVMVVFNDPFPCPDPAVRAVHMAVSMRDEVGALLARWQKRGFQLGFGIGIAHGYATIGSVELGGLFQYTAIGPVCNLAARLCSQASDGQILVTQRVLAEIGERVSAERVAEVDFKGFSKAVSIFDVKGLSAEPQAGA